MKRPVLIFGTFVFLAVTLVFCFSPPKEFLFWYSRGDCAGRINFMYSALYRQHHDPDIVFIGSSKTLNAVDDSLLNQKHPRRALNLGYCRYGRNVDLLFVREYLAYHSCKKMVLEIREEEGEGNHPMSPYLLSTAEVFKNVPGLQNDVFSDVYTRFLVHLKYIRCLVFEKKFEVPNIDVNTGYWPARQKSTIEELDGISEKNRITQAVPQARANKGPLGQIRQISEICNSKGVELYLLYLPSFGNGKRMPSGFADLLPLGKMILLPSAITDSIHLYADENHFNRQGARLLTEYLDQLLVAY